MKISCNYEYDSNSFRLSSIEEYEPHKFRETFQVEYDSAFDGSRYYDFVIDCLNRDIPKIVTGEYAPFNELGATAVDYEKQYSQIIDIDNVREMELVEQVVQSDIEVRNDLSLIYNRLDEYEKVVRFVFLDEQHKDLTTRQRYFAAVHSETILWDTQMSQVQTNIIYLPEYDSNDYGEEVYSQIRIIKKRNEEKKENDKNYDDICKILSGNNGRFILRKLHYLDSLSDTFIFILQLMIERNCPVKICEHCKRYFVPSRTNQKYCDMPSPEQYDKTCRDYISYQTYLNKTHRESERLYKQIYNIKANKLKRTGNQKLKTDLESFMLEAGALKQQVKAGNMLESEYAAWLKGIKEGVTHGEYKEN